jgi:hypothetical protein
MLKMLLATRRARREAGRENPNKIAMSRRNSE